MTTIVEVSLGKESTLKVIRQPWGLPKEPSKEAYTVSVDGVDTHPYCSAEDAMRALGNYLHSVSEQLRK